MASLVHVLRSFQSGALTEDELFSEVDNILESGRADEEYLLETLNEEDTKVPLPMDVHMQVQTRIEESAANKERTSGNGMSADDPDHSRTQIATSLFLNTEPDAGAGETQEWSDSSGAAVPAQNTVQTERMKGSGDVLNDRFVLEECIGTGGMSSVYKALDRRKLEADDRNPYVAVKVLNLEFRAHPDSMIALQREAKKSQGLAHPNIVRVYDFDRDGNTVYMTMEYLPGKSLAKVLKAPGFKGLPAGETMEILEGITRALKFAHENGIIHADFKPANVILTDDGQIKVIDFGIARAFTRPDDTDMEATRFDPGSLGALTPTYASPEMLEHHEPDPRDDIYALACIAYEMLTGRHPFGRMQATEARDGGLVLERRKHMSRRQWKALKSALDFDREKRTPSISKFLADFRPNQGVSSTALLFTMGKAALAASVGFLAYSYFLTDTFDNYKSTKPVAVLPVETAGSNKTDIALAELPHPRAGSEADNKPATIARVDREHQVQEVPEKPVASRVVAPPKLTRESVADLLKDVKCAAFDTSVKGGVLKLRGYVPRKFDVQGLEKDLLALQGAKQIQTNLVRVEPVNCRVIDLFAPYWANNVSTASGASIQTREKNNQFTEGEPLVVEITTPAYDTFVNVDYYSLDGGVVHMIPGPRAENNQAPASYRAVIGDLGEWTVSEPFGKELVTVLFTPHPLFNKVRAEYDNRDDYLAAVRQQLERIADISGKDKITADFVIIETKSKSLLKTLLN
jgi:serine/threonine protein kinase